MHVVVNTSLPVYKKYRITSLLCIFETSVTDVVANDWCISDYPECNLLNKTVFLIAKRDIFIAKILILEVNNIFTVQSSF